MTSKRNKVDYFMNANQDNKTVITAEQKLLGAILVNSNILEKVIDSLKAEHFLIGLHQEIYSSFFKLIDAGMMITPLIISNLLEGSEEFHKAGGQKYLANLTILSLVVIDINDYARIIRDAAVKRQLIEIAREVINNASNESVLSDVKTQIEDVENKIYNLVNEGFIDRGFINSSQIVAELLENINNTIKSPHSTIGISTGFADLDSKLGGFRNTDLIILAARPSMGKTALALNLAVNACRQIMKSGLKQVVGFFSLEMSSIDLAARIISMQSKVDSTCFINGKINEENYNKIRKAATIADQFPFLIDDSPSLTISAIRSRAKKLKHKNNLSILFVDYLQLIKCTEKMDNRTIEVAEITRSLKALAKEINIPIVALSQLSRAVEQRADKRPILSDLRDSGSIEQDADIVMFIYREEYYLKGKEPKLNTAEHSEWIKNLHRSHNTAEIIITKHRKGPTGSVKLCYDEKYSKFDDMWDSQRSFQRF